MRIDSQDVFTDNGRHGALTQSAVCAFLVSVILIVNFGGEANRELERKAPEETFT